jgi:hypothetical protein
MTMEAAERGLRKPGRRKKRDLVHNLLGSAALCFFLFLEHSTAFRAFGSRLFPRRASSSTTSLYLSSSFVSNSLNTGSLSDESQNNPDLLECPFVKRFPRFRIDLTRVVSAKKTEPLDSLLGGLQSNWIKLQLKEQHYQWMTGFGDLLAFCFLWNTAVDMTLSSRTSASEAEVETLRFAFPDAQPQVIRNWLDLLDWIQSYEMKEGISGDNQLICATFSLKSGVPCLELTPPAEVRPTLTVKTRCTAEIVVEQTKSWVQRVLVELSICPFTKSSTFSGQGLSDVGVPVGRIAYHASPATALLPLLSDTWNAISEMILAGPKGRSGVSSILLAAPAFDEDFDVWAGPVFGVLEASVVACNLESQVGVVCFHPLYATPDGSTFPGFGHMHSLPRLQQWYRDCTTPARQRPDGSAMQDEDAATDLSLQQIAAGGAWQRRTPHATINVLRADQLQAAEGRRNTPEMYTRNIQTLMNLGNDRLQKDLEKDQKLGLT